MTPEELEESRAAAARAEFDSLYQQSEENQEVYNQQRESAAAKQNQIQSEETKAKEDSRFLKPEEKPQQPTSQPAQPTNKEKPDKDKPLPGTEDLSMRETLEQEIGPLAAVALGVPDAAMDIIGQFPVLGQLDDAYDEATKFQDPNLQKAREISSVILPSLLLGLYGGPAASKAMFASRSKQIAASIGVDIVGSGILGYTNDYSERNNTLATDLKEWSNGKINIPWLVINDSDSAAVRRRKTGLEEMGLSGVGTSLGFAIDLTKYGWKKLLQFAKDSDVFRWIKPRGDASKRSVNAARDTIIDQATADRVAEIQSTIDNGLVSASKVKDLKAEQARIVKEARNSGYSSATPEPLEATIARDADVTQLINDEIAMRNLEADPASFGRVFTPEYQTRLAPKNTVSTQTVPPLNVLKNLRDNVAINSGLEIGDPAPAITEAAIRKGIGPDAGTREIVEQVAEETAQAGTEYDVIVQNIRFDAKMRDQTLVDMFTNVFALQDTKAVKELFEQGRSNYGLSTGQGISYLNDTQAAAAGLALKPLAKQISLLSDPEMHKASVRVLDQLGKEIATIADASQFYKAGDPVKIRADLLDRLEFLMKEYSTSKYIAGFQLQEKKFWKRLKSLVSAKPSEAAVDFSQIPEAVAETTNSIKMKNAQIAEVMDGLRKADPKDLEVLIDAFAATDGDVTSMAKLYAWAAQQLDPRTLFWSPKGGPSMLALEAKSAIYSNIISIPSAVSAAWGATAGITTKAMLKQVGATIFPRLPGKSNYGDREAMNAVFMAQKAFFETNKRALKYMWSIFTRSMVDPSDTMSIARKDVQASLARDWTTVDRIYETKWSKEPGFWGQKLFYHNAKGLRSLNSWPLSKLSNAALTGIDAYINATYMAMSTRYQAYMDLTQGGLKPLDREAFMKAEQTLYESMFDKRGLLRQDNLAGLESRETAQNLDNALSTLITKATDQVPVLTGMFPFPRVGPNIFYQGVSYTPLAQIVGFGRYRAVIDAGDDINKIKEAMSMHGIDVDAVTESSLLSQFKNLQNEYKVREYFGMLLAGTLYTYAMDGNIYPLRMANPQEQKQLEADNYPFGMIRLPGGYMMRYDNFGQPYKQIFNILAGLSYYYNELGTTRVEGELQRLGQIFAVNFTSEIGMESLKPILSIITTGDYGHLKAVGAQYMRSMIPQSGNLGMIENSINSAFQDVNNDLWETIGKRLPLVSDQIGPTPSMYNAKPIDNYSSPLIRLLNAANVDVPFQFPKEPWEETINEIGWSGQRRFLTDFKGLKLTTHLRNQLKEATGIQQPWKAIDKRLFSSQGLREVAAAKELRKNQKRIINPGGNPREQYSLEDGPLFRDLDAIMDKAVDNAYRIVYEKNPEYQQLHNLIDQIEDNQKVGNKDIRGLLTEKDRLMDLLSIPK